MTTLFVASALIAAGCDSGEGAQLDTIASASSTPDPLPTLPDTVAASTTVATTPAATLPDGVIGLSAEGPWTLVNSAPGINTPGLVYELMPGLWVYLPVVEDVANGITWTLNEQDRPIIEAYLQARLVYFQALTASPMDFSGPGWREFYVDDGQRLIGVVEPLSSVGQVLDLDVGVVLQPTVSGDGRTDTDALVLDCVLNGSVFRNSNGSLAEGSTPGVGKDGQGSTLKLVEGEWLLDRIADAEGACT